MDGDGARAILWLVIFGLLAAGVYAATRPARPGEPRGGGPGPGAAGAVYELLNEDKRKAIEIIVEQRAEARDPEDKDGDLPQLENPKVKRPS
jgi:hypothetical protein